MKCIPETLGRNPGTRTLVIQYRTILSHSRGLCRLTEPADGVRSSPEEGESPVYRTSVSVLVLSLAMIAASGSIALAATPGSWSQTGSMTTPRIGHSMTLLPGGKVLVAGGETGPGVLVRSAELYDPATGAWVQTGSMRSAASVQTAVLLANGKVLVAGGDGRGSGAELYDPATGSWTATRNMSTARLFNTATLLPNGKVLVAGGDDAGTAELYDPTTGAWTPTGRMQLARKSHFAVLLASGKVLVSGNFVGSLESELVPSELYDPDTGTWSTTGSMHVGRTNSPPAVLLPNGKVLVAGSGNFDEPLDAAELYDPTSGTWAVTGHLNVARDFEPMTLLWSGVPLTEGGDISDAALAHQSSELYNVSTGSWSFSGNLVNPRAQQTAALLNTGNVLIAGGVGASGVLARAELYTPPTSTRLASTCGLSGSGVDRAGHAFIKVAVRNVASGLQSLHVLGAANATVTLPTFPPGFREPGVVTATKIDASQRSDLTLSVTNMAGESITCDPVVTQLVRQKGGPAREIIRDVSSAESTLTVSNATPGLERMTVLVNGRPFRVVDLRDGETRTVDLARAMRSGTRNTVVLVGQGRIGASAVVVLSD
jgi:WD40 repeat protein